MLSVQPKGGAAQRKASSFSLGVAALQRPKGASANGVLALAPGESSVGLQVSCGGGVAVLRSVEGAFGRHATNPKVSPWTSRSTGGDSRMQ